LGKTFFGKKIFTPARGNRGAFLMAVLGLLLMLELVLRGGIKIFLKNHLTT